MCDSIRQCVCQNDYILLRISAFALSTAFVSREARYIWVVVSDRCPIPSRITVIGMPAVLAADAQLWRAQYIVSLTFISAILATVFKLRLMLYDMFR